MTTKIYCILISFLCLITHTYLHSNQEKTAVLVIGMPRSGSSCTMGVLQIMGLYLNGHIKGPDENNPKGYFEHWPILVMNERILEEFGSGTLSTGPFTIPWKKRIARKKKAQIKEALLTYFGGASQFGIKDCRLTLLAPLYLHVLKDMGYTTKMIAVLRKPEEIAESFYKFAQIPHEQTLALSKKYFDLINSYGPDNVLKIHFNDLLNNTEDTINAIHAFLPFLKTYSDVKQEIHDFIDETLKHS